MLNKFFLALDSAVFDFAYLFGLVVLPSLAIIFIEKVNNENRMDEVYECIPNVAVVGIVNGQVKEIELASVVKLNFLHHHLHIIFIGDVLDHDCCARVLIIPDFKKINVEGWVTRVRGTAFSFSKTELKRSVQFQ